MFSRRGNVLRGPGSLRIRRSSFLKRREYDLEDVARQSADGQGKGISRIAQTRAIPDYRSVERNIKVYILERPEGEVTHFIMLTFWDNLESVRGFAGEEVERAKYYPEDKDFLLEFEPNVIHYEVVGHS